MICDRQNPARTSLALSTSVFLLSFHQCSKFIYASSTTHTNRPYSDRNTRGLSLHSTNKNIRVSYILDMFNNLSSTLLLPDKELVHKVTGSSRINTICELHTTLLVFPIHMNVLYSKRCPLTCSIKFRNLTCTIKH